MYKKLSEAETVFTIINTILKYLRKGDTGYLIIQEFRVHAIFYLFYERYAKEINLNLQLTEKLIPIYEPLLKITNRMSHKTGGGLDTNIYIKNNDGIAYTVKNKQMKKNIKKIVKQNKEYNNNELLNIIKSQQHTYT